ncbi:PREDICTED: UPF0598 protein C8orf82 homolog [Tinamus guttatus]|uniref:UPF0598 protein C8orf82 homolog n=1 Tax=Tinamus guttatus TaxID=94827 RepID=UPI00052EFE32|nr:PREDICTED: UPF0598 protein C8orf82 homolog [Tinamus guttatus]
MWDLFLDGCSQVDLVPYRPLRVDLVPLGSLGLTSSPLFLDDAKVKNFITCFKDVKFLAFFFKQLRRNHSGRYEADFPYVSLCGREHNYVRCDDRPVVFTQLLRGADGAELLSYCGGGERLVESLPTWLHPSGMRGCRHRMLHPENWLCGIFRVSLSFPPPWFGDTTKDPYIGAGPPGAHP